MYPEQGTAKEMGLVAPRLRRAHYPPLVPVMLKTRQILLFVATLCRFMCALCVCLHNTKSYTHAKRQAANMIWFI